ncbi:transmembrane protein 68 isoform X2 [Anthonomus grandis grandis]|uniref:transmembrane protein 68 isoform X2 n=1 Tax=Anthonomus grandis grandis TaxID=2921223 RepID=UPI002165D1A3|nr:transmembrane protein 68 isoform X2 [Anthonomus grandis grandis]XP_050295270.1 transmembrane protein 68 isoform X2 [Anthonomus grandis grandis]XP_050295271.1 transmembrane protein 68 isoform X2 [Anthonomus grandis grandis]
MININDIFNHIKDNTFDYIDIDYSLWLTWCLAPLLVTFLLPAVIGLLLYISAFTLYVYKLHWNHLRTVIIGGDKWEAARKCVAAMWDAHGWIWHGYEIQGLENLPETGPALIIYYHGAIPIDVYYFLAKIYLTRNRIVHTVADHFLFKIPGFSILSECMKVIPGTVQSCSKLLKEGNYLAIAPGGVFEAQFSVNYNLMWKRRLGFAKVAIDSKVPVIPVFTENLREAFRTLSVGRRFFLKLYSWTKFPFAPIFGGFPVKMVTHIGAPIYYVPDLTPEALQRQVAQSLEELIETHQRLPGNILLSILERVPYFRQRFKKNRNSSHVD